jgi:hypothetical protein
MGSPLARLSEAPAATIAPVLSSKKISMSVESPTPLAEKDD